MCLIGLRDLVASSDVTSVQAPFVVFSLRGAELARSRPSSAPTAADPNFFERFVVAVELEPPPFAPPLVATVCVCIPRDPRRGGQGGGVSV